MKNLNLTLLLALLISLANCKKSETAAATSTAKDSIAVKADTLVEPEVHQELYGLYTGDFIGKEMVKDYEEEYENTLRRIKKERGVNICVFGDVDIEQHLNWNKTRCNQHHRDQLNKLI